MKSLNLRSLSRWINGFLAWDNPVPRAALAREDDAVLRLAESLGVLRRVGITTDLACTVCADEPHSCRVVRKPDGEYGFRCIVNGWVDVSPDDVTLLAFDRQALLTALARGAGHHPRDVRFYAGDRLVRLGFIARPSTAEGWMLAYADGLDNENDWSGVIEALAGQFPKGPGLIATPSAVHMNLSVPNKYQLIALHELVCGREMELDIDQTAAEIRLGQHKRAPGQSGRPSAKPTTRKIWLAEHGRKDWPGARHEQIDKILNNWPSDGSTRPARGTIENHIREFEEEADNDPGR